MNSVPNRAEPRARVGAKSLLIDAAGCAVVSFASLALAIIFGTPDQEEYQLGVFSTLLRFDHLWRGEWPFWLHDYGFGTPLPLGHSFPFHPVFLLWPAVSLNVIFAVFWVGHLTLGGACLLRLMQRMGASAVVAWCGVVCFAFSTPVLNFGYTDNWPAAFVPFAMLPVLLQLISEVARAQSSGRVAARVVALGLVAGWLLQDAHPGHNIVVAAGAVVYAIALSWLRWRLLACYAFAGVLAAGIWAETLVFLFQEIRRFPDDIPRVSHGPLTISHYAAALLRPLWPSFVSDLQVSSMEEMLALYLARNSFVRVPYLGLVFGFAAIVGVVRTLAFTRSDSHFSHRLRLAAVWALLASIGLSLCSPVVLGKIPSGMWLFRDDVTVFAILCAAPALTLLGERPRLRKILLALLALQVTQTIAMAWPAMTLSWRTQDGRTFAKTGQAVPMTQWLSGWSQRFGNRIYLGPGAYKSMRASLAPDDVYAVTDLVLSGLAPVNGWFKNISMDAFYPSPILMHGTIDAQDDVLRNTDLLEVAGVNLVLVIESDLKSDLSPDLVRLDSWSARNGMTYTLFGNPRSWPRATFLDPSAPRTLDELPLRQGCTHASLLCRDVSTLRDSRITGAPRVTLGVDTLHAEFEPTDRPRLLMISETYRPEWRAHSGQTVLQVSEIAGAFVGIIVPPGIGTITVKFDPVLRRFFHWASGLIFLGAIFALLVLIVRASKKGCCDLQLRRGT